METTLPINIVDYLSESAISFNLKGQTKKEVLGELVNLLSAAHRIQNSDGLLESLLEREEIGATVIGPGIALPHAKSESAEKPLAALGISKTGIDFDGKDGDPIYLCFMLISPKNSSAFHLKILAKVSRLLKDRTLVETLIASKSPKEILKRFEQESD